MDSSIPLLDLEPNAATLHADVLAGLSEFPKTLPCKYFYDRKGAQLFEQICETPEYYPTRTELAVLDEYLPAVAKLLGPELVVIEPGSGSGIKTDKLLDALQAPKAYVPVDIARDQLLQYAAELSQRYPDIAIRPVCADFHADWQQVLREFTAAPRMVWFPGSTIGNFPPAEAQQFLERMGRLVQAGGYMLIGVDLQKDPQLLHAAYNDASGVTAQFNLNLLDRLNNELGMNFNQNAFYHQAEYNVQTNAVCMYLRSQQQQTVSLGEQQFEFAKDETICTEYSYKYSLQSFAALAGQANWQVIQQWTDAQQLFSVQLLRYA